MEVDKLNICFHDLFDAQVAKRPDAIAVICENERLTYRELRERANQLALQLQTLGVKPDGLVGICVSRSIDMVVGILGILKSGGAYVPLDPSYPKERLAFILDDANIQVVLVQSALRDMLPKNVTLVVCIDEERFGGSNQPEVSLKRDVSVENLAYVIYTSGSTGKPKGVMISHASLCHFTRIACEALDVTAKDVYLQTASISYALSVRQLMVSLACGATLAIASSEQAHDPLLLFELIKQKHITLMDVVPSFWRACVQRLLALSPAERQEMLNNDLRRIVSVGETLLSDIPRDWEFKLGHPARLVNIFGQTETTGVVATYSIPSMNKDVVEIVPIGRSVSDTTIYILNSDLQPVPACEPGELCVSSPCLAQGYLNRPELTAQKFIPNPFKHIVGERLYRTGDMARTRVDGCIEFLGRSDFQIKIRGQRLELGEVEAMLLEYPLVQACAVVAQGEQPDDKHLVAYIVPATKQGLTVAHVRQYMRQRVPEYMVPSTFIFLDAFPLTPNGKLDRLILSDPAFVKLNSLQSESLPLQTETRIFEKSTANGEFTPARNHLERTIAGIYQSLLKVEQVSVHDNFFDLGGDSLTVVCLFAYIEQEFGVRLPVMTILQAPTVARLAEHIQHYQATPDYKVLVPIQTGISGSPFFCVHGVGGGVLGYRDLVKAMGENHPFYGLQAIGQDNLEICDLSIEAMASRYIDAMRSFQAHGPYRIGGYCFGGIVAYEMACQLEKQGEKVSLLAIFEGFIPDTMNTKVPLIQRITVFWKSIPYWIKDYANMSPTDLRHRIRLSLSKLLSKIRRRPDLVHRVRLEDILETDISNVPDRNIELTQIHSIALHHYRPDRYCGTVTLFRARNRSFNDVVFGSMDQKMGWGNYAIGGVNVREVDGFHRNIHLPPYVKSLAAELNDCLEGESGNGRQEEF
jgi:amino acid adenylation domain-containing protein